MSRKKVKKKQEEKVADHNAELENKDRQKAGKETDRENGAVEVLPKEVQLEQQIEELNGKYLRLYSEFDNFRRRTAKERIELFKSAGQDVLSAMLPILDDFERAIKSMDEAEDVNALKDGISLVYNKMVSTLDQQGLKAFDSKGEAFDADLHEAVTKIPAPSDDLKGKVVDELEKGYKLNDKVIRYAKVVVGE